MDKDNNNRGKCSITVAVAIAITLSTICTALVIAFLLSGMTFLHWSSTHRCHLSSKSILIRLRDIIIRTLVINDGFFNF